MRVVSVTVFRMLKGKTVKFYSSTPRKHTGRGEAELHSFLTSVTYGGESFILRPGRCTPGERTPVPTEHKAGWAPEPVWSFNIYIQAHAIMQIMCQIIYKCVSQTGLRGTARFRKGVCGVPTDGNA